MDDTPAETDCIEYPSTLRIEIGTTEEMFDDAIATAEAYEEGTAETGSDVETVVTFTSVEQLREALSDGKIELAGCQDIVVGDTLRGLCEERSD